MNTTKREVTKEEALEVLRKQRQVDIKKCVAEVESVLEKYSCKIDCSFIIKANSITPCITIIAKSSN